MKVIHTSTSQQHQQNTYTHCGAAYNRKFPRSFLFHGFLVAFVCVFACVRVWWWWYSVDFSWISLWIGAAAAVTVALISVGVHVSRQERLLRLYSSVWIWMKSLFLFYLVFPFTSLVSFVRCWINLYIYGCDSESGIRARIHIHTHKLFSSSFFVYIYIYIYIYRNYISLVWLLLLFLFFLCFCFCDEIEFSFSITYC